MSQFLVTGATGSFGQATIKSLLDKGINASNISALVRDETKAKDLKAKGINLRLGDYDNYSSLEAAFKGVEKLLFVSASDITNRTAQHQNVVKAAVEAGVKHVVYTSFQRTNETTSSPIAFVSEAHLKTEQWLKDAELTYTLLKNGLYMDIIPMFLGEKVLETGTIYQPGENGKAAFVARKDMAEAAAVILSSDGHENKIYDFTGETGYSYGDIAQILSEITEKEIKYISPTPDEFTKTLLEAGVPQAYIGLFIGFSQAIAQGEFSKTGNQLEQLLGRKPMALKAFLERIYS